MSSSLSYVVTSYVLTWLTLLGYALYLAARGRSAVAADDVERER